jgi:hypothetical protein
MSGDEGISVIFNPDTEEFALARASTSRESAWTPLNDIWDDELYRQVRRNLPEGSRGEQRERNFERVRRILEYEIPAVRMVDHDFGGAVEAFTRINTLGVKLKREDIESARVAAKHSGFIADEVIPFLAEIRKSGFARLNVMHLFRVCAFVAKPDGRDRTPLHELERKDVQAAWTRTKRATLDALELAREEFALVNMDLLWSGALLVPAIALCAIGEKRGRDSKGIAGWLASAALLHRYSSSAESTLDQDLRACRAPDAIGALLTNLRKDIGRLQTSPEDFDGALADRGGLFGAYAACFHRHLKDLFTGERILLQPLIERHHILPRAQFPTSERTKADCLANIAFVAPSERSATVEEPDIYLARLRADVLESQCIPADRSLWRVERAEDFWEARKALLSNAFNEYLKTSLPDRRLSV